MGSHVVVEGNDVFWEAVCTCGALVTESLFYLDADCESCGALVVAEIDTGEA